MNRTIKKCSLCALSAAMLFAASPVSAKESRPEPGQVLAAGETPDYAALREELLAKQTELAALEDQIAQADSQLDSLEGGLQAKNALLESQKQQQSEAHSLAEQTAADLQNKQSGKEELQAQIAADTASRDSKQAEYSAAVAAFVIESDRLTSEAIADWTAVNQQKNQGSAGFFTYLKENAPTQGQREDADLAYRIVTAQGTEMQDGTDKDTDYSSYTKLGNSRDATGLENFEYAVMHVGDVNEYRAKDAPDLPAYRVSSSLMATSERNGNAMVSSPMTTFAYDVGESRHWRSDPFSTWYTSSKNNYLEGDTDRWGQPYANIISEEYTVTGYAYIESSPLHFQDFAGPDSRYAQGSFTPEEYQALFADYKTDLQNRLDDANARMTSFAGDVLEPEYPGSQERVDAWTAMQTLTAEIESLNGSIAENQSELETLESEIEQLQADQEMQNAAADQADQAVSQTESEISALSQQKDDLAAQKETLETSRTAVQERIAEILALLATDPDRFDRSQLELVIVSVQKADESKYSFKDDSIHTLLNAAKAVYANPKSQEEINASASALHAAWLEARRIPDKEVLDLLY